MTRKTDSQVSHFVFGNINVIQLFVIKKEKPDLTYNNANYIILYTAAHVINTGLLKFESRQKANCMTIKECRRLRMFNVYVYTLFWEGSNWSF